MRPAPPGPPRYASVSDFLASVANIPGRSTLHASSCGNLVAETSTNWRQSLFCCCTASMVQATDGAAIDGLVSSWSENISVSFCLWAPGYGLTLWCALGLPVDGAIQVPQLQLQLQTVVDGEKLCRTVAYWISGHMLFRNCWSASTQVQFSQLLLFTPCLISKEALRQISNPVKHAKLGVAKIFMEIVWQLLDMT